MTANLTITDILFFLDNVLIGDTPAPGADPLAPAGIRAIDGSNNNITGLTLFDQFGNFVDTGTFGNVNQAFINYSSSVSPLAISLGYVDANKQLLVVQDIIDASPRIISNLIADATAANPATAGVPLLAEGDPSVDRLPENSLFTFFGQFFDHGLDFVAKGDNGSILIPIATNDPLFASANPLFPFIPVTRATRDINGDITNTTAPFVEQSQTYGSAASTTFYLMEYDVNGVATGDLVHGINGGMGTWADIKANALKWAVAQAIAQGGPIPTEMLTDAHVLNIPDPTLWDVATGTFLLGAETGQAFLADIAHTANPGGGKTADANAVIDPHGFLNPGSPAEYDDELLDAHFVSGDPRVNENSALTAIHEAFHGEHTRILHQIEDWIAQQNQIDPTFAGQWTGEMKFQAAKIANEMQYQHLVFEEFGRRMSPNIDAFAGYQVDINPNIMAEFAHAVYRLGHSQLTDIVKTMNVAGDVTDLTLIEAFLDPVLFEQFGAGDVLKGTQFETGGRIDEFVVDALRNFLVGLPLDLAAINIARGRDIGLPSLNQLRADIFAKTGESTLAPYASWGDFHANLLNPDSIVNFVAAYTTNPTVAVVRDVAAPDLAAVRAAAAALVADPVFMAGNAGLNNIDLWMGGLAEKKVPLGLLGSTFDFIFAQQMLALQNGDRFYYLARIGGNLLDQIEGQTLADLMMRSADAIHLNGDVFGTPDVLVELGALAATNFLKTPAEMVQYLHEIIGGTNSANTIQGGGGNDAIYGEGGNDTLFGGENDDHIYGGQGNDVIWGDMGFDFLRGDDGNDEIHGGADDDAIFGNRGNDLLFGDNGFDAVIGGEGNDTIFGGAQDDELLGGDGHDEIHGGDGADAVEGDAGNDVLFGDSGDDLMVGGEGDDMLFGGSGGDALDGGVGGYDIASYADWLESLLVGGTGLTIDILNTALSTGDARNDSYLDIEEIRGTKWNDAILADGIGRVLNGGAGNDTMTGGAADDTFIGMEGNDRFVGGGGVDTVLFRGAMADFDFLPAVGGQTVVHARNNLIINEGSDFVSNTIAWMLFDDGLINIASGQFAPLVGVSGTHERVQNGTTIIGELESDLVLVDGTAIPGTGLVVGNIEIVDPDGANGGAVTLALAGADAASFAIQNVGGVNQLRLIGGGIGSFVNYEAKKYYNVTVSASDAIGASAVNLTINVSDVNDNAPVVTSGDRVNVKEGTNTDAILYWAHSTDLDTVGPAATYTLGGTDAAHFSLINGELRFLAPQSYVTPGDANADNIYDVTIQASDGTNLSAVHNLAVHVTSAGVANTIIGTGADNFLNGTGVSDLILGLGGNDTLVGQADNDRLEGGDGNDWLLGYAGNDLMLGDNGNDTLDGVFSDAGPGADTMDGGEGNDLYIADGADVITDTGVTGFDRVAAGIVGVNFTTVGWSGVERIIGSTGADTIDASSFTTGIQITGLDDADLITGGSGNDIIAAGTGNDTVDGGDGNDIINGGAGDDVMTGGGGNDVLYIDSALDVVTDGGTGNDVAAIVTASSLAYAVSGWTSVERVVGLTGNDTIDASGMATPIALLGGAGDDSLVGGLGGDSLLGGSNSDVLIGGAGADVLLGHAGADTLEGGADNDVLVGGTEADVFRFDDGWGVDTISGWEDGLDLLDFTLVATWVDFATSVTVGTVGGNTVVDLGGADQVVLLGLHAIDVSDFV